MRKGQANLKPGFDNFVNTSFRRNKERIGHLSGSCGLSLRLLSNGFLARNCRGSSGLSGNLVDQASKHEEQNLTGRGQTLTLDAGFFDPAREAGLALPAREAGLAADAGLADAFEAGLADALDAGLAAAAAAFEAGLVTAALDAGLVAALEAGFVAFEAGFACEKKKRTRTRDDKD